MPSLFCTLRDALFKNERNKLTISFLRTCQNMNLIPKGLRLHFNLANHTQDPDLVLSIKKVLNQASSRILDILLKGSIQAKSRSQRNLCAIQENATTMMGEVNMKDMLQNIKQSLEPVLTKRSKTQYSKLRRWEMEVSYNNNIRLQTQRGSLQVKADTYLEGLLQLPEEAKCSLGHSPICKEPRTKRGVRPHRRKRNRAGAHSRKIRKEVEDIYIPTEEELKAFDPIVLAPNVILNQDQISICRLSDRFVPMPRTPVDICDMIVGTHAWAERLRWRRFYFLKKSNSQTESKDENWEKKPWYRTTGKAAPKGDPALEQFIQSCTKAFLDEKKRKKIKDNLTAGQRKAIRDLKNLPTTHGAACRFADKAGVTVITNIKTDDDTVVGALKDRNYYDILPTDPHKEVCKTIHTWAKKWLKKGAITEHVYHYVTDLKETRPGKCKPLIKTHKKTPFPTRLLLTSTGSPIQPLSKFVQQSIQHLPQFLPYQITDTKDFIRKIEEINKAYSPLPPEAVCVTCDVVSLFPNVNNEMGVPATEALLRDYPNPDNIPIDCVLEALQIVLNNNYCSYTDSFGCTVFARPNRGTAMGPSHSCDYVDVFMGELDKKLTQTIRIPMLSSLSTLQDQDKTLDWNRYRDDGFAILTNEKHVEKFKRHLQNLHPPNIRWEVNFGREATFLDVSVKIEEGKIITDVNSKHCHSYLPPTSCHPRSVFKGLIKGMGLRLRMICSEDKKLKERIEEYSKYLTQSGWNWKKAKKELTIGASQNRHRVLNRSTKSKKTKIAWVTTFDPRVPSKSKIIKENLETLYSDPINRKIFPKTSLISADRRRKNIAEMFKPTVPKQFLLHGPVEEPGFFTCQNRRCDTCKHAQNIKEFKSSWNGRIWKILKHLTCTTKNVIYAVICKLHPEAMYIGSTKNLKLRWANHKSDNKLKKTNKCRVARHVNDMKHPDSSNLEFLTIFAIDSVQSESRLLTKETFYQCNIGTIFCGLNSRKDFNAVITAKNRIQYRT